MTVTTKGRPTFDPLAFTVSIVDEAAGEFVKVFSANEEVEQNTIAVNAEEWPALRDAVEYMVGQCKDYTK